MSTFIPVCPFSRPAYEVLIMCPLWQYSNFRVLAFGSAFGSGVRGSLPV